MGDNKKREALVERKTKETSISCKLLLDGTGKSKINTGIGFLDHMLEQVARHGLLDIELKAEGDLHIDMHHTTEDIGIVMGTAIKQALGDKAGIRRFSHIIIPMDEALTQISLDISVFLGLSSIFNVFSSSSIKTDLSLISLDNISI